MPLRDYNGTDPVKASNVLSFPAFGRFGSVPTPLTFSAMSINPTVAEAKVSEGNLLVSGKLTGPAQVTVTGTDIDGATVSDTFNVDVSMRRGAS